jgi:hypothetical protein
LPIQRKFICGLGRGIYGISRQKVLKKVFYWNLKMHKNVVTYNIGHSWMLAAIAIKLFLLHWTNCFGNRSHTINSAKRKLFWNLTIPTENFDHRWYNSLVISYRESRWIIIFNSMHYHLNSA